VNEEVRASMRSGISTWSSGFDSGSTKHSSVFTKISSLRDSTTTTDMSDTDHPKRSMTVEDTVDLYSHGFQDEPPDLKLNQIGTGGSELELRTAKIAQAMNEPLSRFGSSTTIQGRNALTAKATPEFEAPGPPALRQPTETHDQYGFRKASREVTVKEWNAWWKDYSKTQARRTTRWISLMKGHGLAIKNPTDFPQRSPKTQRYVRKGVPPAWRGNLWYYYAGGQAYANRFPGLYQELVAGTAERLNASDKEAIDRDIHRTFPDNLHFKPEQPPADGSEPPLLCSLRRLLYAFAIHHPRIGYCQSLNFLAGLLLLFVPEEMAFWLLHIVTSRYLPGTHEVSLEGANIDLWVLMLALKDENPTMWNKIGGETSGSGARLPPVSLVTTPWFMSLFIGTLPIESVLRVWDLLFYDGSPSIFRAALAIFRLGESEISRVSDPMEIFQVVQAIPRKMLDATTLAMVANGKGAVNGSWIETKRRERRAWYAEERAAEKSRRNSGEAQAPAAHTDSEDIKAQTAARNHAPPMGRHLSAARSAGDLSRTKSKGLFTRRSGSRAGPEEPLPALRRPADPKLPVRGSSLEANVNGKGVNGNEVNGVGINGKPDTPTPKFGTPKARPGTPHEREGSLVVEGV
jgi:TBC1 domain family member 6